MVQVNVEAVRRAMPGFAEFWRGEGQKWQDERDHKDKFFAKYFGEEQIEELDKGTVRELINLLWAFNGWTNKDYLYEEMLTSGLENIRGAFRELLHGKKSIDVRFDAMKGIRMMGAASISEVLAHHDHKTYPIYNARSKRGLIALGVDASGLPKSAQISGSQYQAFCKLVVSVQEKIAELYPDIGDLFKLDFLLYYLSVLPADTPGESPPPRIDDFDHGAAIEQLLELGDGLGFEVKKEYPVGHGCIVDAIWRSRIANLGTISYAFEVHRRGSRDSAILNLQRVAISDQSIQKVIIVALQRELDRFRDEIGSLPEGFRNSVAYFAVQDLQAALERLQGLKGILDAVGLLNVTKAIR